MRQVGKVVFDFPSLFPGAMPNAQLTPEQVQDEAEKLFLEQAKAYYRDLRQAAQSAPVGKIIAQADDFAFQNRRELIRKSLQAIKM